jgi:SAM-dependent methyltransferase
MGLKFSEICSRLETWYAGPRGQYLLEQEEALTSQLLDAVFGYHQLQIGVTRNQPLALDSHLGHKIYANLAEGGRVGLVSGPDCLPFADDSIDVVVLHHALEFAAKPHALLREAHRVLAPQGHIIVLGFNPASLFGAITRVAGWFPGRLWSDSHHIGTRRLKDWLNLLGTEVQSVRHCFATPPAGGERLFRLLSRTDSLAMRYQLPLGGVYAVFAQKKVTTLTPTRIRWRKPVGSRLIGLSVPKPVASPREGDVAA